MCRRRPGTGIKCPTSPGFSADVHDQSAWYGNGPRSAIQSLKTVTVGFGYPQGQTGARFSSLNCRWQPARLRQPELVSPVGLGAGERGDTDINGRPLLALSGHRLVRYISALTQSGHLGSPVLPIHASYTVRCFGDPRGYNEAARVHQACWWGGYLAACSERATASYACHRVHERAVT